MSDFFAITECIYGLILVFQAKTNKTSLNTCKMQNRVDAVLQVYVPFVCVSELATENVCNLQIYDIFHLIFLQVRYIFYNKKVKKIYFSWGDC